MATLTTRLKVHIKKYDDKEGLIKEIKNIQAQLQELLQIIQSEEFLSALNRESGKLYLRDVDTELRNEVITLVTQLKVDYNELPTTLKLRKPKDLSRNFDNINEICDLLQIKDNIHTHMEQTTIPRVAKVLRDESNTMKNMLRELGLRRVRVSKEDIKDSENRPSEEELKSISDKIAEESKLGWHRVD